MAEEIQEAVQIIRVAYDGIEIAMKVGSGGIAAMQKAIDFLKGMLDYEKSLGKTSMRKLLLKGGDLQVLQFKTEDMRKVERMAKKYGILYSVLPDCNKTDGMSEVIFHTEAVPRVNMMIQKLKFGRIATFDDYLKNGDEKSLGKLMDFLRKQQGNEKSHTVEGDKVNSAIDGLIEKVGMFAMEKQAISVEQVKENFSINGEQAENVIKQLETIGVLGGRSEDGTHKVMMDKEAFTNRIRGYQSLADRMRAISASKNTNLSDVTISKKLIAEENDHAVKTRVPGTWGKDVRYVGLHKEKRKVFSDYSLGMKQRLGIAAAIMHEPELLILDEPINGLDPIGIVEIRSFLSELSHNHGITIFISSHVLSEIEQIADIIGVMHEGHLVEEVNISELHKRNRKYIQFDLSDSEIAGKILENHYHMTDFTVQDGTVRIYDFSQSVGEINREFARNGLLVTRINDSEENLEDYFSKLIGGGGIA